MCCSPFHTHQPTHTHTHSLLLLFLRSRLVPLHQLLCLAAGALYGTYEPLRLPPDCCSCFCASLCASEQQKLHLAAGALYGTYEAFRYKVPGLYKVRYIGQVRFI